MKGGLNKEDAKRFSHLKRNGQKNAIEQNKEEEGIEMETKPKNERRRKIFSSGVRLMFSQMDKFQHSVTSRDVTWAKSIRLSGLLTLKLTPIMHPIVKKFL